MGTDSTYGGEPGWRECGKCGCLFYYPNRAQSVCQQDGGTHVVLEGTIDHQIRVNVPDMVGYTYWHRCVNCQALFVETRPEWRGFSHCPKVGRVRHVSSGSNYVVILRAAHLTVMAEAPPDLLKGNNLFWTAGMTTPYLRWYDGSPTPYRIHVQPFTTGASSVTVEWWNNAGDTWVDFHYAGAVEGTFSKPYRTFADGIYGVPLDGLLHLKTGHSPESARVTKRMRIVGYNGPATIGR
jgi:hypothetical protein